MVVGSAGQMVFLSRDNVNNKRAFQIFGSQENRAGALPGVRG
jgi:hypothetical protein